MKLSENDVRFWLRLHQPLLGNKLAFGRFRICKLSSEYLGTVRPPYSGPPPAYSGHWTPPNSGQIPVGQIHLHAKSNHLM